MKRILIISDGKKGHLNQSIAFCKIKDISYDILEIKFKSKPLKSLSYVFDKLNFYTDILFEQYKNYYFDFYDAVVSTGSSTYYFNKFIAKKYEKKSIVLMYPRGYSLKNFDYVIAQEHDTPPNLPNIITIPLNLSSLQSKNLINKPEDKKALGIIIGGDNKVFDMDINTIKDKLDYIFKNYENYLKYITTSRRTSFEIEALIDEYEFDYKLIYSREPDINPIGDFTKNCDEFFISMDSTSMLSEVRANSDAKINIIELKSEKTNSKYHKIVEIVNSIDKKVNFEELLLRVEV